MRWKMGTYELKYNPKEKAIYHKAEEQVQINANGIVSNPNIIFDMNINLSIMLYDKQTYTSSAPSITFQSGYYIDITEKRTNERMFLLRIDGKIDAKYKDGSSPNIITLTAGTATLPSTNPISIAHMDTEIALLYAESSSSSVLLIADENGVAKRKYTYSNTYSDNIDDISSISWDSSGTLYALNPFGKIYSINPTNGTYSLLYELEDFSSNVSSSIKTYSNIMSFRKQGRQYIAYLKNKKEMYFMKRTSLEIQCKADIDVNSVAISFGEYSGDFMLLTSTGLNQTYPNTCSLDIAIIEDVLSQGLVDIYDEAGIPMIMYANGMSVKRIKNKDEARYEIDINGVITHSNQSFNGGWTYITR